MIWLNAKGRPEGSPWCQVSARQRPKADVPRDTHDEAPVTLVCSHAIVTSVTQTYRQSGKWLGKTASRRFPETGRCYPAISANAIIAQTAMIEASVAASTTGALGACNAIVVDKQ